MKVNRRKLLWILAALAALLLPTVRSVVLPFALALFLAACLQRPIEAGAQRHIPRLLSALGILVLFLAPMAAVLGYGVYSLLRSLRGMAELLIPLLQSGSTLDEWLYRLITAMPPQLQNLLLALTDTLADRKDQLLTQVLTGLGQWSTAWIAALPGQIAKTGLFLLYFLFCAVGYPEVRRLLRTMLPRDWLLWLSGVLMETKRRLGHWCRAEARLVGLIFGELALGLSLLRLDSWLWMAVLIALVDMVPLVGSGLILMPWAAIRILLGSRAQGIGLILLWACVWCTRTLLEPRLVGRQLQLPTAISFFAAILGMKLLGLKGLILFPVLAAVAAGLLSGDEKGAARQSGALKRWD